MFEYSFAISSYNLRFEPSRPNRTFLRWITTLSPAKNALVANPRLHWGPGMALRANFEALDRAMGARSELFPRLLRSGILAVRHLE